MHYMDRHVATYIDKHMLYLEPALEAIRAHGLAHKIPIITNDAAAFLRTQIHLKKPLRILEVGTAIGFSGSVMLLNCQGHLDTLELDEPSFHVAAGHFAKLGLNERVTQHLGDASIILEAMVAAIGSGEDDSLKYDFIFIDAAKGQYLDYFTKCEKLLRSGGVILTDNVLYKGMVAGLPYPRRQRTIYSRLNGFIDYTSGHPDFYSSLLSVGDGMMLCIRKE